MVRSKQDNGSAGQMMLRPVEEARGDFQPNDVEYPEAPGQQELPPSARLFVFVLFTQVMQALMSYDGGATQMSTSSLLEHGWSSSELGLLGAMDKFGQVGAAVVVSSLLMKYNNKLLLSFGLFAKAASCLCFGILSDKMLMLVSKLGMGGSEALIGVWATVWVQGHAPRDAQARWLGFASISAGLGNGAGSAIAGLCSKSMGYSFAFVLQSVILFSVLLAMLVTPNEWFDFTTAEETEAKWANEADCDRDLKEEVSLTGSPDPQLSARQRIRTESYLPRTRSDLRDPRLMFQQEVARRHMSNDESSITSFRLTAEDVAIGPPDATRAPTSRESDADGGHTAALLVVLRSRLWLWSAMAISLSMYVLSSVSYLWQNTVENVWDFDNSQATWSFLLTTGVGGFLGVSLGPKVFDEYLEGFGTTKKKARCLRWCSISALMIALLGSACAGLFWNTAYRLLHYEVPHQPKGGPLILVLASIFAIFAFVNSMMGTLYGINTDSVSLEHRPSAASLTVALTNIVGYAAGTLIPGFAADYAGQALRGAYPTVAVQVTRSAQFTIGMAVALTAGWPLLCVLVFGKQAAQAEADDDFDLSGLSD